MISGNIKLVIYRIEGVDNDDWINGMLGMQEKYMVTEARKRFGVPNIGIVMKEQTAITGAYCKDEYLRSAFVFKMTEKRWQRSRDDPQKKRNKSWK